MSFDELFNDYVRLKVLDGLFREGPIEDFLLFAVSDRHMKAIKKLSDRDKRILLARIIGEYSFRDLGLMFGMKTTDIKSAYYYIIRKIRKGSGHGF